MRLGTQVPAPQHRPSTPDTGRARRASPRDSSVASLDVLVCLACQRRFPRAVTRCPGCRSRDRIALRDFLALQALVDDMTGHTDAASR